MSKIHKIVGATFVFALMFTNAFAVSAYDEEINRLEVSLEDYEETQNHAHLMAESARNLGFPEDDEVIQKAKEIWYSTNNEKVEIVNQLNELKEKKFKEEQEQRAKEEQAQGNRRYLGVFKLTGYCPCYSCSEGYGTQTASGNRAVEGITVAVDRRVLPLGTKIYIEGVGERVVQDVGGAINGNRIDVYVNNHSNCFLPQYNQSANVYIID